MNSLNVIHIGGRGNDGKIKEFNNIIRIGKENP